MARASQPGVHRSQENTHPSRTATTVQEPKHGPTVGSYYCRVAVSWRRGTPVHVVQRVNGTARFSNTYTIYTPVPLPEAALIQSTH